MHEMNQHGQTCQNAAVTRRRSVAPSKTNGVEKNRQESVTNLG